MIPTNLIKQSRSSIDNKRRKVNNISKEINKINSVK